MRILTFSNCPLQESQGSGYVILNFVRGLRDAGHEVTLVDFSKYQLWPGARWANRWRRALGLWREVRQRAGDGFDVIEFYGADCWLAARSLARWQERKFVMVQHANGVEPHMQEEMEKAFPRRGWRRTLALLDRICERQAFARVDGVVTVSRYDEAYVREKGWQPEGRLLAIENPLPAEFLGQPCESERGKVIGFCGSWIERKGRELVARDLGRLLREDPEVRLLLVGVGEDFAKEAWFGEVAGRVEVHGQVADKAGMRRLYQRMAILVAPSYFESFGLAVAEAMSCGCAVAATATGFACSLRHLDEVFLLERVESPRLYEAVRQLINNPSLRERIARGGYAQVQRNTWPEATVRLSETYERWVRERQAERA